MWLAERRVASLAGIGLTGVVYKRDRTGHAAVDHALGHLGDLLVVLGVAGEGAGLGPDPDLVVAAAGVGPARRLPEFGLVALAEVLTDRVGQQAEHCRPDD